MEKRRPVNPNLPLNRCWDMVNRIKADDPKETRKRCQIAEEWLTANKVISIDEYDELMMTVAYLCRESYHLEERR